MPTGLYHALLLSRLSCRCALHAAPGAGAYWRVLSEAGISRQRLESFDRWAGAAGRAEATAHFIRWRRRLFVPCCSLLGSACKSWYCTLCTGTKIPHELLTAASFLPHYAPLPRARRAIVTEPEFFAGKRDALIGDMENYLKILKSVSWEGILGNLGRKLCPKDSVEYQGGVSHCTACTAPAT